MTRYFYDTEFVDDGHTIDLISIAFVSDDNRQLYLHLDGYDRAKAEAHPFVSENVLPYLNGMPQTPRHAAAQQIADFLKAGTGNADLWGYYPSYDQVALAQLYGTMMDLPEHIPMRTNCVAQLGQLLGVRRLPIHGGDAHDALADARWTRDVYNWLAEVLRDAADRARRGPDRPPLGSRSEHQPG